MATETNYNPLRSVGGSSVKAPSEYTYKLADVSASDAGRTEDYIMQKKRVGQQTALDLAWNYLTDEEIAAVLTAFDPEYINITYKDAKANAYLTKEFYVTDRTSPMYNCTLGLWTNLSFSIVSRKVE
jgi:hypothetical protein